MGRTVLSTLVALTASVAGLLRAWPQAFRILQGGDTSGVSAQAWTLMVISSGTWVALGLADGIPLLVLHNLAAGAGSAAVVVLACRRGHANGGLVLIALALAALVNAAMFAVAGPTGVGTLAAGLAIVSVLPQVYKVLRQPAVGVSRASWLLALISVAAWAWYGVLIGQPALIAGPGVLVPAILIILWRTEPAGPPDPCGARPALERTA